MRSTRLTWTSTLLRTDYWKFTLRRTSCPCMQGYLTKSRRVAWLTAWRAPGLVSRMKASCRYRVTTGMASPTSRRGTGGTGVGQHKLVPHARPGTLQLQGTSKATAKHHRLVVQAAGLLRVLRPHDRFRARLGSLLVDGGSVLGCSARRLNFGESFQAVK